MRHRSLQAPSNFLVLGQNIWVSPFFVKRWWFFWFLPSIEMLSWFASLLDKRIHGWALLVFSSLTAPLIPLPGLASIVRAAY